MSALKIRNALNQWEEVPMLKGDTGDTALSISLSIFIQFFCIKIFCFHCAI